MIRPPSGSTRFRTLPYYAILAIFSLSLLSNKAFSQSPGQIVRPVGGTGITVLNPNGDGYSSATTAGFTTSDITQSEIAYKVVPPTVIEPTGDVATGPNGGSRIL